MNKQQINAFNEKYGDIFGDDTSREPEKRLTFQEKYGNFPEYNSEYLARQSKSRDVKTLWMVGIESHKNSNPVIGFGVLFATLLFMFLIIYFATLN